MPEASKAKRQMLNAIVAADTHGIRPSHAPRFQRAVADLLTVGYSFEDIERAAKGQVSLDELINAVRQHLILTKVQQALRN